MLKKTMTYTDYDGIVRTEDFYFNLTKAELTEMDLMEQGGLKSKIQNIVNAKDVPSVMKVFKDIILKSYGQKSPDGRRFIKNQELTDEFVQTPAYSELFMELAQNNDAASEFINGVVPQELAVSNAELANIQNNIVNNKPISIDESTNANN